VRDTVSKGGEVVGRHNGLVVTWKNIFDSSHFMRVEDVALGDGDCVSVMAKHFGKGETTGSAWCVLAIVESDPGCHN
jgi:hypothetical protein